MTAAIVCFVIFCLVSWAVVLLDEVDGDWDEDE